MMVFIFHFLRSAHCNSDCLVHPSWFLPKSQLSFMDLLQAPQSHADFLVTFAVKRTARSDAACHAGTQDADFSSGCAWQGSRAVPSQHRLGTSKKRPVRAVANARVSCWRCIRQSIDQNGCLRLGTLK